jgi:hypothetical protein
MCCTQTQDFLLRKAFDLPRNVKGDVKSMLGKYGEDAGSILECVIGKIHIE